MSKVLGQVSASGEPRYGTGFTVAHPKEGEYSISFIENQFKDQPVVLSTVVSTEAGKVFCTTINSASEKGFDLYMQGMDGKAVNRSFNFVAESAT